MAGPILTVGVEKVNEITVVALTGPIDSATLDQFKAALDPVFEQAGCQILLDCTGLTYVNSKGLAMLTNYHRKCFGERGYFALCSVNRKLVRTMDLLGLGRVLKFYDTREQAVNTIPNVHKPEPPLTGLQA